jgi:hypothetical protein
LSFTQKKQKFYPAHPHLSIKTSSHTHCEKTERGDNEREEKPSTHDQGAVGVIAIGSVDDGSGSESGDGDEIGDGIGSEDDMTDDGGVGDGGRRGVLDWCVLGCDCLDGALLLH